MKEKVLFVAYNAFNRGGIQNVVMNIVKNLHDDYIFDLLCFQEDKGTLEETFLSYGGEIIKYPTYYAGRNVFLKRLDYYVRGFKIFGRTRNAIRENGPYRVVHCNNALESGVCLLAAKLEKVPVRISHAHTNFRSCENVVRRGIDIVYRSLINRYSTKQIGCSEEACEALFGRRAETAVLPSPYDCSKFDPVQYAETKFDVPSMIQVASYSSNKNQLFSITVLEEVVKKYPEARLSFVGFESEAEYLEKVEEAVWKNGLEKNVSFFPSDADIPFLMSEASYFLFPSVAEGFGLAPVEAQAMGLRCFVSDSIPASCDCGGCCFLPLNRGAGVWADAIIEDFEETTGKHGTYDCGKFSISSVCQKYRALYRNLSEEHNETGKSISG